jgi:hypothetical protein
VHRCVFYAETGGDRGSVALDGWKMDNKDEGQYLWVDKPVFPFAVRQLISPQTFLLSLFHLNEGGRDIRSLRLRIHRVRK